tara:strand:- start:296 stop:634 length:339 start_codon:yes stop_codon:yes gene_type:complete
MFSSANKMAIGSELSDGEYHFDKEKNLELGNKPADVKVMSQFFPWITIKNNKLIFIKFGECILPSKKLPVTFDCLKDANGKAEKNKLEFLQSDNSYLGWGKPGNKLFYFKKK